MSETAVASPAVAVTPAEPALDTRLAIQTTGLPPGTQKSPDSPWPFSAFFRRLRE